MTSTTPSGMTAGTPPVITGTPFGAGFAHVQAPPEDRVRSPYTGLTREHWVAAADDLLLSAARYRSPDGARIDLPGRPSQQGVLLDGLEGFARTFLLAAFRSHAADGDPRGHLARYTEGAVAGTRGGGREAWAPIGDVGSTVGQAQVEAASIALALHLTRTRTWDAMAPDEQDRLEAWLRQALRRLPAPNNWYLFPLTVASFLEAVGRGDAETAWAIDRGLGLLEGWYRGEGWYSDGDGRAFDHYVGWAMHLYPMFHAVLRGDTGLRERLGGRLHEFLDSFARTFDRTGAPLYHGRSMTYRMATLAAVAMGEVGASTPLAPGQSRRILSAGLRYFFDRGATHDGVLTLGWHGPHLPTLQRYSGPGSPYWAAKGFSALMLPAEHAVWSATEAELDADRHDHRRVIGAVGMLVQSTAEDGLVRVHNHGSDHLGPQAADGGVPDPLYARFAYSTRTGPTDVHNPSDNDVQIAVGGAWSGRRRIHPVPGGTDWVASWHAPSFIVRGAFLAGESASEGPRLPATRILSAVAVSARVEVRVTRFVGVPPGVPVRLSGWAASAANPDAVRAAAEGVTATVTAHGVDGPVASQLVGVRGWDRAATTPATYGTAFGEWAVVPELYGRASEELFVALGSVTGSADPGPLDDLATVEGEGDRVVIHWADRAEPTVIDFAAIDWS